MSMKYTDEQQRVIDARGCDLLVSAAAGSGKTAVLVQRILDRVMDMEHPVDIDRMLIMTFTRAAAGNMRTKLTRRLAESYQEAKKAGDKRLAEHLLRQNSLIRGAYISTIDGFCTSVLRNHFSAVDIDPAFRVAQDGELRLLRNEVLEELLETEYEEASENFIQFIESYSAKKDDKDVVQAILKLYDYSQSAPYPDEWLEKEACSVYLCEDADSFFENPLIKEFYKDAEGILKQMLNLANQTMEVVLRPDGPYPYAEMVEHEIEMIKAALALSQKGASVDEMREVLLKMEFGRLAQVRDKSVNADMKDYAQGLRGEYKDLVKKLLEVWYYAPAQYIFEDVKKCAPMALELCRLTLNFAKAYKAAKIDRCMVDFQDLEHYTIDILSDGKQEGEVVPSKIALEYRDLFEEIYVDEYQDSNNVQEEILKCICRREEGQHNLFMVGDIKQSIYRFRLADPTLFMDKCDKYESDKAILPPYPDQMRMNLSKNFRSRSEVVDSVNYYFDQLMIRDVGGVEYDQDARLVCQAEYTKTEEGNSVEHMWDSELLLIQQDDAVAKNKAEMEAIAVASRIKELMGEQKVMDADTKELRPIRYSDIAILLRATNGVDDIYQRVFYDYGIPLESEVKTGYFSGYEIDTVINLLSALGNPRDDEVLCAVLKGYFGKITNEELASIRIAYPEVDFYEAAMRYAGYWEDIQAAEETINDKSALQDEAQIEKDLNPEIVLKLKSFFDFYDKYRKKAVYLKVYELIDEIVTTSGFEHCVRAMENGQQRIMNLDMLVEKASSYEKTSYYGLFNFLRYINLLKKYEVDYGSAQANESDSVTLMTTHKSKGLEFPVCFVCGMNKAFNTRDTSAKLILDSKAGIGLEYVDAQKRISSNTIIKRAVASKIQNDMLGEELRILYVALTRAMEKLIITSIIDKNGLNSFVMKKQPLVQKCETVKLTKDQISEIKAPIEWLLMSVIRDPNANVFLNSLNKQLLSEEETNGECGFSKTTLINNAPIKMRFVTASDLVETTTIDVIEKEVLKEKYEECLENKGVSEDGNKYTTIFNWKYPYYLLNNASGYIPSKVSVSMLKHETMEEAEHLHIVDERFVPQYDEKINDIENNRNFKENKASVNKTEADEPVPAFIKADKNELLNSHVQIIGSLRGTAYHRMFELLDYDGDLSYEGIEKQRDAFVKGGYIEKEWAEVLSIKKYASFVASPIGKRMQEAHKKGLLKREQPFCIAAPAREVNTRYHSDEPVLIQGIIDAMFYEEGEIVIVDYKTDRVKSLDKLVELYKTQLDYYAKAAEQITGRKVRAKVIYSVCLDGEIEV